MHSWQLISMEVDRSSVLIGDYFEQDLCMPIKRVKAQECSLGNKSNIAEIVENCIGDNDNRNLVLYGSGYFHHYTYGLCKHADRLSSNYAYMHFDHHSDFGLELTQNEIGCASFVSHILNDTNASAGFFFGSRPLLINSPILRLITGHFLGVKPSVLNCSSMQPYFFRNRLGRRIFEGQIRKLPEDVYLSFDLDLMCESEMHTDFYQGDVKTDELLRAIDIIKKDKRIIGADILGYAGTSRETQGLELYEKIASSVMEA